jgi:quinolinate synthase
MLRYAKKSTAKQFIIATETGIIHALKKQNPEAEFIAASERAICPNMKKITLEKILWSLEDMQYKVTVPEEIRKKARKAIDKMVEILPAK